MHYLDNMCCSSLQSGVTANNLIIKLLSLDINVIIVVKHVQDNLAISYEGIAIFQNIPLKCLTKK